MKMNSKIKFLHWSALGLFSSLALVLQGCASGDLEKKVNQELAQETEVTNRTQLKQETTTLIQEDKELSADQKEKLLNLKNTTQGKVDEIYTTTNKLKSILFKDMLQPHYDENEVELIKDRLHTLESEKLSVTFGAITEANKILGHQAKSHQWLAREFFFENAGGRIK